MNSARRVCVKVTSSTSEPITTVEETRTFYVSLAASAIASEVLFEVKPMQKGQAVFVQKVQSGSESYQAGFRPGQRLVAICDSVRSNEMWSLEDRPSLNFVKMTLQMMRRNPATVQLEVGPPPLSPLEPPPFDATQTIGEQLEKEFAKASGAKSTTSDVQTRIKRRMDYLQEVEKRNDSVFLGIMFASFVLPAAVILAAAYFTGYLDTLYSSTMYMR